MSSRTSSIPRRHVLWLILALLLGWVASGAIHNSSSSFSKADWTSYATVVTSASASMVSLTIAIAAILYALLGSPLLKFLHEKGALNRVLFDLIACALVWLAALAMSIITAHPNSLNNELWMRIATTCVIAGISQFIPIGFAFWNLLKNSGVTPSPPSEHDFSKKTVID